jgi:large subunit ribosomal protein L30
MSRKEKRGTKKTPATATRKPKATKKPEKEPIPQKKPSVEVKPVEVKKPSAASIKDGTLLLVIRLKGAFAVPYYIECTLKSLRLERKYRATLVSSSPSTNGMLRQVKDFVTWGEISSTAIAELLKERGEVAGGIRVTDKFVKENFSNDSVDALAMALSRGQLDLMALWKKGVKPIFRLRPPSGGFVSTIKRPVGINGQLGYRGPAIAALMTKMA